MKCDHPVFFERVFDRDICMVRRRCTVCGYTVFEAMPDEHGRSLERAWRREGPWRRGWHGHGNRDRHNQGMYT